MMSLTVVKHLMNRILLMQVTVLLQTHDYIDFYLKDLWELSFTYSAIADVITLALPNSSKVFDINHVQIKRHPLHRRLFVQMNFTSTDIQNINTFMIGI